MKIKKREIKKNYVDFISKNRLGSFTIVKDLLLKLKQRL